MIFDKDMVLSIYNGLTKKVDSAKKTINKPLTLTEKILYSHLETGFVKEEYERGKSYVNLHLYPMYQNKIAYGSGGFPWSSNCYKGNVSYDKGICPIAESMNDRMFLNIGIGLVKLDKMSCDSIIESFKKVWKHLDSLK